MNGGGDCSGATHVVGEHLVRGKALVCRKPWAKSVSAGCRHPEQQGADLVHRHPVKQGAALAYRHLCSKERLWFVDIP